MAVEIKQNLKQVQSLSLSPQIQQAIKILLITRQELESFLTTEMQENPCLEEDNVQTDANDYGEADLLKDSFLQEVNEGIDQIEGIVTDQVFAENECRGVDDLLARFQESGLSGSEENSVTPHDSDEISAEWYEVFANENSDLYEDIEEQLNFMHISEDDLHVANILLQYIDINGYLEEDLAKIALMESIPICDLKVALKYLQSCDPPGICARNLQECLLLQLERLENKPKYVEDIIKNYWSDFEKQDFCKIAKSLKIKEEAIYAAVMYIRHNLDPKPARQYIQSVNQAVIPDVYVFKRDGKWIASINEDGLPRLKISKKYENMIQEVMTVNSKMLDKSKVKSFVNEKLKNAKWIIRALQERNRTIVRVTEIILKKQEDFFERGPEFLRPLNLKDISDEIGVHESTISRATSNKYMYSPRGIIELKYFFKAGIGEGESTANETVRVWVNEYIKHEAIGEVLSDQDIADLIFKEKGVKVARRTIAKYREMLGILSSAKRTKQNKIAGG